MTTTKKVNTAEITIMEIFQGQLDICILGTSPLIYNAMSNKAKRELLMPSPKKNTAERASKLKHNPPIEFVESAYKNIEDNRKTRLNFPSSAFKKALSSAALDIPGAAKSQIGRLVWVDNKRTDIFGIPQLLMSIVRSADINRTPDVRTRAILPEWACKLSIHFMRPILKEQTIVNLLAAAGFTQGIGDWRQQKGSDSYGQFKLVSADDPDFVRICKEGTLQAQDEALRNPKLHDDETQELYSWFVDELVRREGKKNGKESAVEVQS